MIASPYSRTSRQPRGHAYFAESFSWEDVVCFVEDDEVLEVFSWDGRVLAQQKDRLEEEQTEESLLVLAKPMQLEDDGIPQQVINR